MLTRDFHIVVSALSEPCSNYQNDIPDLFWDFPTAIIVVVADVNKIATILCKTNHGCKEENR